MLELITGGLSSLLAGGATGLLGSLISRFSDYKLEKLRFENKRKLMEQENEQIRMEAEFAYKVTDREASRLENIAGDDLQKGSYGADVAKYLPAATGKYARFFMGTVDFIRGLIRPAVTIFLLIVTYKIAAQLHAIIIQIDGQLVSVEQAYELWVQVINQILYLTSAAVLWWFGSRPKAQA